MGGWKGRDLGTSRARAFCKLWLTRFFQSALHPDSGPDQALQPTLASSESPRPAGAHLSQACQKTAPRSWPSVPLEGAPVTHTPGLPLPLRSLLPGWRTWEKGWACTEPAARRTYVFWSVLCPR